MIELNVSNYCHNCPNFKADVSREIIYGDYRVKAYETKINCVHAERCNAIYEYLKKEFNKTNENYITEF